MDTEKEVVRTKLHIAISTQPVMEGMGKLGLVRGVIYNPANVFSRTNEHAPGVYETFFYPKGEFRVVVINTSRGIRAFVDDIEKLFEGFASHCIEGMIAAFEINPRQVDEFMSRATTSFSTS